MPAVAWERISKEQAEDVISMLLNNLYPDAERIRGAGGDEGRDVQIRLPDGRLHVFEIKGFTGGLTPSRRRQIKRSLRRAAQLEPLDWTLLMPIDPTPGEERWLRTIRDLVAFPTYWHGRMFLDSELARRPWIERYLLGNSATEVVRLMTQANLEQAALGRGAIDALERIERIANDLNELDPFYRWRIASDGQLTTISPTPRYRGAESESPLMIQIQFQFADDAAGRRAADELRRHVEFGTPLDVPQQYVQSVRIEAAVFPAGELLPGGRLIANSRPGHAVELVLEIRDPGGDTKAKLPMTGTVASSGTRGSIVELHDATGFFTVRLTVDFEAHMLQLNFRYQLGERAYAMQLRPAIALLAAMASPNLLELRTSDGQLVGQHPIEERVPDADARFVRLLDELILIQWAAGRYEPVSIPLSEADLAEVWLASRLLRGEPIESTWNDANFTFTDDAPEHERRLFVRDSFRVAFTDHQPYVARIDGREYPVGRGVVSEVDSATLAPEHDDWRHNEPPPGARVRLVPKDSNVVRRWLLTDDAGPNRVPSRGAASNTAFGGPASIAWAPERARQT